MPVHPAYQVGLTLYQIDAETLALRRDARNDDVSANAMKIAPTVARPILFPVESAATSTGAISSDRQAARRRSTERRLQAQITAATMASGLITISA